MYEFVPNVPKRAEQTMFWSFLVLGLLLFGFSSLRWIPLARLYRGLAILFLLASGVLYAHCLNRSYRYRVEPRDGATRGDVPDFVVIERRFRSERVVCRISVADMREILAITKENKRAIRAHRRNSRYYDLTAFLFPPNSYLLLFEDAEQLCTARIFADEHLLSLLIIQ